MAVGTWIPAGHVRGAPWGLDELRAPPKQPLDLESISAQWEAALDAAESALHAAGALLPGSELSQRRSQLAEERRETAAALLASFGEPRR